MQVRLPALLVFCLLTTAMWSQANDPHQEAVIRATYAQLAYLTQLKIIGDAGLHSYIGEPVDRLTVLQQARDAEVVYTLNDFTSGAISEIAQQRWLDVVTGDEGREVLEFTIGSQHFSDNKLPQVEWPTATAHWIDGPTYTQSVRAKFSPLTVAQMLQLGGKQLGSPGTTWLRYTSFSMTVTFQGKASSFKALFLFGKDVRGNEESSPQNLLIRSASAAGDKVSYYPRGLLQSHIRDTPIVAEWLGSQAVYGASCTVGKRQLCCSGLRCGISVDDLHNELSSPILSPPDSVLPDKP